MAWTTSSFRSSTFGPTTAALETTTEALLVLNAKAETLTAEKETISNAIEDAQNTIQAAEDVSKDLEALDLSVFVATRRKREVRTILYPSVTNCAEVKSSIEDIAKFMDSHDKTYYNPQKAQFVVGILTSLKASDLKPVEMLMSLSQQ